MAIDRAAVRRIARLARLELDEPSVAAFAEQLQRIVDYAGTLGELELEQVSPTSHLQEQAPRLRDDVNQPSLPATDALAPAPHTADGHFCVPRVLDE